MPSITLLRDVQRVYLTNSTTVYRVRVEAVDPVGMPVEIFRHKELPARVGESIGAAEFNGVCSPVELSELSAYAPPPSHMIRFFRLPDAEIDVASRSLAEEALRIIEAQVDILVRSVAAAEILQPLPPLTFSHGD